MKSPRTAFTMIELLIVVAIIGVLAGLVLTGVSMLREQARRVNCGNNVRSWGLAIVSLSVDNGGNLPTSHFQTNRWCPEILALDNRPARKLRESNVYPQFNAYGNFVEFNVTTMAPYLDGGDAILALLKQAQGVASTATSDGTFKAQFNAWRCPSQRGGFGLIQASAAGDYADYIIGIGYAYFGRTDVWATMHAMNPGQWSNMGDPALLKQLGGRRPEAEQVLMNDLLYTWQNGETWGPNHVKSFSTNQTRAYSGNYLSMSGNNTLFGDGRVAWKPAAEFQLAAMQSGSLSATVPHTQQFSNNMGYNFW